MVSFFGYNDTMQKLLVTKPDLSGVTTTILETFLTSYEPEAGALVVTLQGDLGAGKTTFTQMLAATLGVTDTVTSPTFVIMKQYETSHPVVTRLIHIDAYRLETVDELLILGWVDWLRSSHTLICVEWPERIAELIPETARSLSLTIVDAETREITYA
jgi:tRNA threonylcarbamoyladenosine biosynthesis protein TsaE